MDQNGNIWYILSASHWMTLTGVGRIFFNMLFAITTLTVMLWHSTMVCSCLSNAWVVLQSCVPKVSHPLPKSKMAYNCFPLCFNSFWAKPMGYQNGLSDVERLNTKKNGQEQIPTAKKQHRCINLSLFNRVRSTTLPLDHPCHTCLQMGSTHQITPYTHNKAHGLRHV